MEESFWIQTNLIKNISYDRILSWYYNIIIQHIGFMRNPVFDIMKGFGILLVIAGHLWGINKYLHSFIFSFHMPLFFILGGYFFKPKDFSTSLSKDFKRLIQPYLFTCALIILYQLALFIYNKDYYPLFRSLIASLWGNGSNNHSSLYFANIPSIGAIWFLLALFWCKNIYNIIPKNKYLLWMVLALSIIATLTDRYLVNLPLTILPGLSAIVFFAAGNIAKQKRLSSYWFLLGIPIWIYCIVFSGMSIVRCYYKYYPLDIIGGITGTYTIYLISKISYSYLSSFSKCLAWLGKNSLAILCYHLIVMTIPFIGFFNKYIGIKNYGVHIMLFFVLPILFTIISLRISFVKKIFGDYK